MTIVVATYPQKSALRNQHSTPKSAHHATTRFSTPAYTSWGERIRTSDWLIQNQNTKELGQKLVFGAAGRSFR